MQNEADILKDIASGKYRGCYLVYNRKSTDDTDNQKNSIKYQKAENARFAYRAGLPIAPITIEGFATDGIISERHSGFKEDIELVFGAGNTVQYRVARPKFHKLVELLSKGLFKGVIILCWDRASRNKGDDTILRKLMKAGVDIRFTLAQYDKTSAGELHMDIDGMFAEHHSRITREKVKLAIRAKRDIGICTHRAPVGYLNLGHMEHKPFDPDRAPCIKRLFELAATGEWSLADLTRWAADQGFRMSPMRRRRTQSEMLAEEDDDLRSEIEAVARPLTPTGLHKILTNRFYVGRTIGNEGVWIKSISHEALVSDALFEQVQLKLHGRKCSVRYPDRLGHPLRGLIRCAVCRRVYTPYMKKGIVYFGARCAPNCTNALKTFNFKYIADKVGALLSNLSFTEDERAEINAQVDTDFLLLDQRRTTDLESKERRKRKIREDLVYIAENRLTLLRAGVYTPEKLAAEETNLNAELATLRDAEGISDVAMRETVADIIQLSELLKEALPIYSLAKPSEKENIIRTVFSELTLSENAFDYQCKKGFRALASRFIPMGDLIGWLSELQGIRSDILESIIELGRIQGDQS